MKVVARTGIVAALLFAIGCPAWAAVLGPIPIALGASEKVFPFYSTVRISPDGKYVAYSARDERRVDVGLGGSFTTGLSSSGVTRVFYYASDIYVTNVRTGRTVNITGGQHSSWQPQWSKNGDKLAFVSDRDGLARVWEWDSFTEALRRVSRVAVFSFSALDGVAWANGDTEILAKTMPPGLSFTAEAAILANGSHSDHRYASGSTATVYDHMRESGGLSRATQSLEGYDGGEGQSGVSLSLINVQTGDVRVLAKRFDGTLQGIDASGSYLLVTREVGSDPLDADIPAADISVIDLRSGGLKMRIHNVLMSRAGKAFWAPTGPRFAYFARRSSASYNADSRMVVADISTGTTTAVTPPLHGKEVQFGGAVAWTPDARAIVATVGGQVWLVDLMKHSVRHLWTQAPGKLPDIDLDPNVLTTRDGTEVWQPAGARSMVYVQAWNLTSFHQQIDRISLTTGAVQLVRGGAQQFTAGAFPPAFNASANGATAVYIAWDAAHPPDVWATTDGFQTIHRCSDLNPELANYVMGKQEVVSWMSTDGIRMYGTLLLPAGYVAGRRYPTVVWQREGISGPTRADTYGLFSDGAENWQILATRGYAVFMPDYPTEKASDVARLLKSDILPGLDRLVALGISDTNRFGITGESLGGETSMMITADTDRFKASVNTVGPDNEINAAMILLQNGDANRFQEGEDWIGGTPWSNLNGYVAGSVFFHLDRIHTPTLILESRDNWEETLPQHLSDDGFVGLRHLNKTDVEYVLYSGGHGPSAFSYADRVDFWYRVVHWFDKYLKGIG